MQKIIRQKVYDTDTATLVNTFTSGQYGDPAGFEERLYRNPEGFYFLYGLGGAESLYPRETIRAVSTAGAVQWQTQRNV